MRESPCLFTIKKSQGDKARIHSNNKILNNKYLALQLLKSYNS